MNKITKKLVSAITACALVVGMIAGTGTITKAATVATTLVPTMVTDLYGNPTQATTTVTLPGSTGSTLDTTDSLAQIVQIPMEKKGVLSLAFAASALTKSVDINLYSDAACTMKVGTSVYMSYLSPTDSHTYTITTPATYYLKISWSSVPAESAATIAVGALAYNGGEVALTDSYQLIWTDDYNTVNYHTLVLDSDSLVTLSGASISSYDATTQGLSLAISDKDKMTLAEPYLSSSNQYFACYALKKGSYYVSTNESNPYQIKATVAKVTDKSGSSKKKAKLLKNKKSVSGMIALSEGTGKADWYKIKLNKKSKVKVKYTAYCTDSLKVEVIPANKRQIMINNTTYLQNGTGAFGSKGKWSKGTYYLKVTKTYETYSGSYTLKRIK